MAEIRVFEAVTKADRDACLAIRRVVFIEEQGVSEVDEVDGDDPLCRHYLATVDGAPTGAARLKRIDGALKAQRVAVLKSARGTGVGAALMRHMIDAASASHPGAPIVLGSQIDALGFYEKLGFVAEGAEYMDAGIRHQDMRLTPNAPSGADRKEWKERARMAYSYDDQNVFAKILRGEIPNKTVLETEHSLAFHDIHPAKPVHVLVIPKGPYVTYDHFIAEASDAEIVDFSKAVAAVCKEMGVSEAAGGNGYRLLANSGPAASQEVPHLHIHVFGGGDCGPMIKRDG